MWQEFPNFKTNTVNLIFIQNNETVIILTLPHTVKAFFLVHLSFILPDFKKKILTWAKHTSFTQW